MIQNLVYMCITCGYLFNEAKASQQWSELPDDWKCPDCQAAKENFSELVIEPPAFKYPTEL